MVLNDHDNCPLFTDAEFWNNYGTERIEKAANRRLNNNVAKNVIVFLGDGMGVTTNTAARILKGQLVGQSGEEANMVWDEFPHVSLSKVNYLKKMGRHRL